MSPSQIIEFLYEILEGIEISLDEDSHLVGSSTAIDSMSLVQLCIKLEEVAIAEGFTFDWTSEKAMSNLNSIFRSPKSISEEFNTQQQSSRGEA